MEGTTAPRFCSSEGDDDLGGLAVGNLGQGLQAPQGQHLVLRLGLVQQPDGVGLGLLDGQDGLGLAFGFQDPLLLDSVGPQDGSLFFALGGSDGGLFFAFCLQDDGALFPLGLHLFLHGVLDLSRRGNVLDLHTVDLDAPLVGGFVQDGGDLGVDDVRGWTGCGPAPSRR